MINTAKEEAEIIQEAPKKYFLCKNVNKKYLGMEVYDSKLFTKMTVFFICKFAYGTDINNLGGIEIIIQQLRMHWPQEYASVNLNKASVHLNENHISLTLSLGFFDRESSQKLIPLKRWLTTTIDQILAEINIGSEENETSNSEKFTQIREELDQLIEKNEQSKQAASLMEEAIHALEDGLEKQTNDLAKSSKQNTQLDFQWQEQKLVLAAIEEKLIKQQQMINAISENQSQDRNQSVQQKETLLSVQQALANITKDFSILNEKAEYSHTEEQLKNKKIADLNQEIKQLAINIQNFDEKTKSVAIQSSQSEKNIASIEQRLIYLEQDLKGVTHSINENQKNAAQRANEINLLQQDISNIRSTEQTMMSQLIKNQEQLQKQLIESAAQANQSVRTFAVQPKAIKKLRHFSEPKGYTDLVALVSQLQKEVNGQADLLNKLTDSLDQTDTVTGVNIWEIDKSYHFEKDLAMDQEVESFPDQMTEIVLDTDEVPLQPTQNKKQVSLAVISEEQRRVLNTLETKIYNNFAKNKTGNKHFVKRKEFQKLKHEIEYLDYFWTLYKQIEKKKLLFQGTLNCESLVKQSDSFIDKMAKIYRYARIFNRWVYCPGSTFAELQGYFYIVKYLKYYLRCTDE